MNHETPWYSTKGNVHHRCRHCTLGNKIAPEHRRDGTGDKNLCSYCAHRINDKHIHRFSRTTIRAVRPDILEHWGRVGRLADFEVLIVDALALTIAEFESNPDMTWSAESFLAHFRDSLDLAYDVLVQMRRHGDAQQFTRNLQALVTEYLGSND